MKIEVKTTIEATRMTLSELGAISDKAKSSWEHYGFDRDKWTAVKMDDGPIIVVDESKKLNDGFFFTDEEDFIRWLEQTADEREHIDELFAQWLDEVEEGMKACGKWYMDDGVEMIYGA